MTGRKLRGLLFVSKDIEDPECPVLRMPVDGDIPPVEGYPAGNRFMKQAQEFCNGLATGYMFVLGDEFECENPILNDSPVEIVSKEADSNG